MRSLDWPDRVVSLGTILTCDTDRLNLELARES